MMVAFNSHLSIELSELLAGFTDQLVPDAIHVTGLCLDSRTLKAGDLFLACSGNQTHGANYISKAVAAGAIAIVYEADYSLELPKLNIPVISIENLHAKVGEIAHRFYQYPSNDLKVIGITGTNGKTSVAWFLSEILNQTEKPVGMIGTLGKGLFGSLETTANTTPDPVTVHKALFDFKQLGAEFVVMEVSSHALEQSRVAAVNFYSVIFTNLSHEHLDYHGSMHQYANAKKKLFTDYYSEYKIINIDDELGKQFVKSSTPQVITYSLSNENLQLDNCSVANVLKTERGYLQFELESPWGNAIIETGLLGEFNVYNLLATISVLCICGMELDEVANRLRSISNVPGRMESFQEKDKALVVVDYAHTPDALEKVLKTLKQITQGWLFCVFGCGGDRDQAKRAEMGKVASEYSDHIVLTNDNPRTENPEHIIDDIKEGISESASLYVELDRAEAIAYAISLSNPGDVILVAGKGHEDYQIVGDQTLVFDDRVWVKRLLEAKGD